MYVQLHSSIVDCGFLRFRSFQKLLEAEARSLVLLFLRLMCRKELELRCSHLVVYLLCRAGQRNLLLEDVALLV
jgi:hypothetical protein